MKTQDTEPLMRSQPKYAIVYGRTGEAVVSYLDGTGPIRTAEQAEETQFYLEFTTGKKWKILKINSIPEKTTLAYILASEDWRQTKRREELKKQALLIAEKM